MKRLLIAGLALTGAGLWVGELGAHGGTYRGPGDTVPPGAGGGGGGGPTSGGPSGPTTGGPGGPSTPGPTVPGATGGTSGGSGGGTTTVTVDLGPDLTAWSFWWEFNKEPFINLKAAIADGGIVTGSGDFFLGQGEEDQVNDTLRPTQQQIRGEIVPALLAALESETNPDIVTGALIALAKIGEASAESGDNAFETTIAEFLNDGSQEISETAALSLGILASDNSVDLLEGLARDSKLGQKAVGSTEVDPRSQAFAAYGLGLIGSRTGDPAVAQRIVAILADLLPTAETLSRQDLAVACVISMGLTPLEIVAAPAEDEAVEVGPADSRQGQIDFLLEFMLDENKNYMPRAHVPTAVARLMDGLQDESYRQRVVDALLLPLDTRRGGKYAREVRQSCALALGLIGDSDDDPIDVEIRKALIDDATELQSQGKKFALMSMAKVAARPGSGAKDLAKNRRELTDELVKNLRETGGVDRWATMGLGVYGYQLGKQGEAPDAALATQLRDRLSKAKSPDDVGSAAVAAGLFGDAAAKDPLLKLLDATREPVAQGYVALGLGMLNEKEAIEPIQKVLDEAEYKPELLQQAAIALGLLGSKETVGTLISMLESAGSLASQAAAAQALGFIGDRNSVTPLVQMLEDDSITETARGFAAVALGIVADKEDLPWNSKIAVDLNYRASTSTLNTQDGKGVLNIL